ncbi:MAG: hypothetical protein NTX87_04935 [Planctomycetota bacterium]|nr:hypothetical protein [Planctomycetota bacterium]
MGGKFHARTKWLAVVAGAPLVLLLIAMAIPILFVWAPYRCIRDAWRCRRFLKKNAGRSYLVWNPHHRWHDFMVNNVLPVLPEGMESVRVGRGRPLTSDLRIALIKSKVRLSKPYVVAVAREGLKGYSVNARLLEFKKSQGVDAEVRNRVADILGEVAQQLLQG